MGKSWLHRTGIPGLALTAALAGCGRDPVQITNAQGQPIPAAEVRPQDVENFVIERIKTSTAMAYELRETIPISEKAYAGLVEALNVAGKDAQRSRGQHEKVLQSVKKAVEVSTDIVINPLPYLAFDHFENQVVNPLREAKGALEDLIKRENAAARPR